MSSTSPQTAEIRVDGKTSFVPAFTINDLTLIVTGKRLKTAAIRDEDAVEGPGVTDPSHFVRALKEVGSGADLFTFSQKPPETQPRFAHYYELDNIAAVPITTYDQWWEGLPQETRKKVRRAAKRDVTVKVVPFDDELVREIHRIYNLSPIRQGRPFWHYGKDVETVKREHATYLGRSEFIGAYHNNELIAFIKMVYVDSAATLFHIIAADEHHDKRPMNALVAKAIEVCVSRGMKYFVYGKYTYGNKTVSPLAEFKRRNGFLQIDFPKYYVPLTPLGAVALKLRLHRGLNGLLPPSLLIPLIGVRRKIRETLQTNRKQSAPASAAA